MRLRLDIFYIFIALILWLVMFNYWQYLIFPISEMSDAQIDAPGMMASVFGFILALIYLLLLLLPIFLIFGFLSNISDKIFGYSKGKLSFENGDIYEGELRRGKMDGKGIYTFKNSEKYKGRFRNNKFHGKGVYTYPDGTIKTGKWKNDEYLKRRIL